MRAGETDAPDEVERIDEGRYFRLRNPVFRETWKPPGFEPTLPLVAGSRPPRLVWISTWGCYIEFLYCGQASHEILTTSEASVEWQLQHARFRRAREGKGKISAAISKWRRLSERKPTNIEAFVNLGQLHLRIGEHAEARACYEKAAALAPDDLRVLDLEAALATNWDERVAAYRRTLEHYPNLRDASSSLGWFEQLSEEDRSLLPPPAWPSGRDPGPN
jgi:tetratricopeptide (TPR) repeat protein